MNLAVPDTFAAALRLSWQQRRAVFDIALVPIIFSLAIDLLFQPLLVSADYTVTLHTAPTDTLLGIVAFLLLSLLPWSAFAVGWIRYCLLGAPSEGPIAAAWTLREIRFFGAALKLVMIYTGCMFVALLVVIGLHGGVMPTSKTLVLLGVVLLIMIGYLLARLSLILPAAAADLPLELGSAWRFSQGNGWRLFAVMLLLVVVVQLCGAFAIMVANRLLRVLFATPFSLGPRVLLTTIKEIISYACWAPFITALALGFRQLTGWQPDGSTRLVSPPTNQAH